MPFDWLTFLRSFYLLFFRVPEARVGRTLVELAFRLTLWGVNRVGWTLDDLRHRAWRVQPVEKAIFIIGHQRSGTTYLHRLLSSDTPSARTFAIHEMLFPSVSIQQGFERLGAWDRGRGGGLARRLDAVEEKLFGGMDNIHRVGFRTPEEDEFVLWAIFASGMNYHDHPFGEESASIAHLREFHTWPEARRRRVLGYYRACVRKKLYRSRFEAGPRWFISKNPAFSHKIADLRALFPDARFVYLVRNPLETIPSRLSLIREIWRTRFTRFREMTPLQSAQIYEDSLRTYLGAESGLADLPTEAKIVVPYTDLVADPRSALESMYEAFDLPVSPAFTTTLERLEPGERREQGGHAYTLAEFGLTREKIRRDLAPVFETYRFEG